MCSNQLAKLTIKLKGIYETIKIVLTIKSLRLYSTDNSKLLCIKLWIFILTYTYSSEDMAQVKIKSSPNFKRQTLKLKAVIYQIRQLVSK